MPTPLGSSNVPAAPTPDPVTTAQTGSFARGARTLLAIATLLVILGAGNVIVGRSRANDYTALLSKAAASPARQDSKDAKRVRDDSVHIRRVRSRIAFYEMVDLGGRCFLAGAGILLLASLIPLRLGAARKDGNSPYQKP